MMNDVDVQLLEQKYAASAPPEKIPLGVAWMVARLENLCRPRPCARLLNRQAEAVMAQEERYAGMRDQALAHELAAIRGVFRLQRDTRQDVMQALALLRELAFRVTGLRPYACQIAGALGIFEHCIVEMATGEGKTLTAALAAAVVSLRGKGCHVLTSNDYLAARDAGSMADFFAAAGVSCGAVTQGMSPTERCAAYAQDITYMTSKEVVADFLRDRLALGELDNPIRLLTRALCRQTVPLTVQRGLYCAIVDEADSVLCDGGGTPLIISTPDPGAPAVEQYQAASDLAVRMQRGQDYLANPVFREIKLTDEGRQRLAQTLGERPWAKPGRAAELLAQALEAREFFYEAVHYVVQEGKIVLVDEATGRIMPDHEWRDGMHQAVAAKEGLAIVPPKTTSAQSTFQDFFRRYPVMGGMTGTALEARNELYQFYDLHVVKIRPHRPVRRRISARRLHQSTCAKVADVVRIVSERQAKGQPVLVGTSSIDASMRVSTALTEAAVPHETLNAVHHSREADIVAQAGQYGRVTVATNMAGRGTDIKLTPQTSDLGGLLVILTERYSSRRVDRQLHGRSGRQGEPGEVMEIISLEDTLFAHHPIWRGLLKLLSALPLGGNRLAFAAVACLQWHSARRETALRRRMVKANQQFARMISYKGQRS